jgi:hypothetical protein
MRKLIYGVGVNDADYRVTIHKEYPRIEGKRVQKMVYKCPIYRLWYDMLKRCYCKKYLEKTPTYKGCTVTDKWLSFMNFRDWVLTQDWEGKVLDKDILIVGNKIYSETTCVFVYNIVNNFINTGLHRTSSSKLPIGVSETRQEGVYRARCSDPFKRYPAEIGRFTNVDEAHKAWLDKKKDYAIELANSAFVDNIKVKEALILRYTL